MRRELNLCTRFIVFECTNAIFDCLLMSILFCFYVFIVQFIHLLECNRFKATFLILAKIIRFTEKLLERKKMQKSIMHLVYLNIFALAPSIDFTK